MVFLLEVEGRSVTMAREDFVNNPFKPIRIDYSKVVESLRCTAWREVVCSLAGPQRIGASEI